MIGTWTYRVALLLCFLYIAGDQLSDAWQAGRAYGYQEGFQRGLQQQPQAWRIEEDSDHAAL